MILQTEVCGFVFQLRLLNYQNHFENVQTSLLKLLLLDDTDSDNELYLH